MNIKVKKTVYILFATVMIFSCGNDAEIDRTRYVDDLFNEVEVFFDIKYGENAGLVGSSKTLYLDVYEPSDDNQTNRPLIILAHGGAFVSGTKNQIKDLCISYAKKGYVVASMSSRLINDPSISDSIAYSEGVVFTLSDMKAAIRFNLSL